MLLNARYLVCKRDADLNERGSVCTGFVADPNKRGLVGADVDERGMSVADVNACGLGVADLRDYDSVIADLSECGAVCARGVLT